MSSDLLEFSEFKKSVSAFVSSGIGREALDELVPFESWDQAERRWAETAEMMELINAGSAPTFGAVDEIREILEMREGAVLEGQDIVRVGNSLKTISRIAGSLVEADRLERLCADMADFGDLCREIDLALLPSGEVSDRSNPYLKDLRSRLWNMRSQIMERLTGIMQSLPEHAVMDELITTRGDRYVIPIRHDYVPRFKGITHDYSRSRQTVYLEPMEMVDDNNAINRIRSEIREEEYRILKDLTGDIIYSAEQIRQALAVYAGLDLIHGCAAWAVKNRCVIPGVSQDEINIKGARHPLLMQRLGRERTIPLDIRLSKQKRCLVVSGPNAGGKTVALKTLGILMLMARCGIPLPADADSVVPRLGNIWVDMDTSQDIAHDLSSFTAHALNLKHIYENLTEGDMVLLDEPGSSTDSEQGGAFAAAYIAAVLEKGAYMVVTSHSELVKFYAVKSDLAENAAMAFDESGLKPVYRIEYGLVGGSHAFEILKSVGFPDEIVRSAGDIAGARGQSSLAKALHDYSEAAEMQHKALLELEEARRCRAEAEQSAVQERSRLRDQAVRFDRLLKKAEKMALRQVSSEKISELKSQPEAVELQAELKQQPAVKKTFVVEKGSIVTVRGGSNAGEVLEINGAVAVVDCGGKRLKLTIDMLEPASGPAPRRGGGRRAPHQPCANPVVLPVVVVGMRVDEALTVVEKAADRAMLSGQKELEIIHGGGTGALKGAIREHLGHMPGVSHVGDAPPDSGGSNRTIVRFNG